MNPKVSKVIALVSEDLNRGHTLASLAASVNLSTSRLRHLFKEETGSTFSEYMRLLRVRKAADLLATTFLSVKEIMCEAGLTNQSHFVRVFKKEYGLTPTSYRASRLGEGLPVSELGAASAAPVKE
jgi:AraC family transcriptional regulator, arabinose operon regulatory protein